MRHLQRVSMGGISIVVNLTYRRSRSLHEPGHSSLFSASRLCSATAFNLADQRACVCSVIMASVPKTAVRFHSRPLLVHVVITDVPRYMITHGISFIADSIGGELMWAGGLSLISDIPRKAHWPLKSHIFVNAGRLDRLDLGTLAGCFRSLCAHGSS